MLESLMASLPQQDSVVSGILAVPGVDVAIAAVLAAAIPVAGIAVYNFLEGETLVSDLLDEWRLSRRSLAEWDRVWARNPSRKDVMVSLTTIPSRLPYLAPTLKSLLRQSCAPRKIIVNLPFYSLREKCPYDIPDWLIGLSGVEIHRVEDLGPATKLLPTLKRVAPDQPIIVVDDDRLYHQTFIADLVRAADALPGASIGHSGWIVPADLTDRPTTLWSNWKMRPPAPVRARRIKSPVRVDVLQGLSGYLVRPDQLNLDQIFDYSGAPDAAFFVDDVWVAGHRTADAFVVPAVRTNFPPKWASRELQANRLGTINRGKGGFAERHNSIVIRHLNACHGAFSVSDRLRQTSAHCRPIAGMNGRNHAAANANDAEPGEMTKS